MRDGNAFPYEEGKQSSLSYDEGEMRRKKSRVQVVLAHQKKKKREQAATRRTGTIVMCGETVFV